MEQVRNRPAPPRRTFSYKRGRNATDEINPDNKSTMMVACRRRGLSLFHANPELQNDLELVSCATGENPWALQHASAEMRDNPAIVLECVKKIPLSLYYASSRLKSDINIALAAVRTDGLALKHVSPSLRGNLEVVTAALTQNAAAVEFVAPSLLQCNEDDSDSGAMSVG